MNGSFLLLTAAYNSEFRPLHGSLHLRRSTQGSSFLPSVSPSFALLQLFHIFLQPKQKAETPTVPFFLWKIIHSAQISWGKKKKTAGMRNCRETFVPVDNWFKPDLRASTFPVPLWYHVKQRDLISAPCCQVSNSQKPLLSGSVVWGGATTRSGEGDGVGWLRGERCQLARA